MINERFQTYFQEKFFSGDHENFIRFLGALERPIPKTIRIKPGKTGEVTARLKNDGYIVTPTVLPRVFEISRREDFDPLERRLGYSLDHLIGNFYIQELAAAHPVDILADGKISEEKYLILDMASSPGGKTTQLAEYFPQSFIIANEPTRERIPQLLQNLDRMGSLNIGVTLYPGQYFARECEVFDRILLDAPCSGEGTAFRGGDVLKNWHIKNVKKIAHLQEKLLEAALIALKVGGEMVYSTCTLNTLEDEEIIEAMITKYSGTFEVLFQKKWWPHIDGTGGFFVTKIKKTQTITAKNIHIGENTNEEISRFKDASRFPSQDRLGRSTMYYTFREKVLATIHHPELESVRKKYYFMRLGEEIAQNTHGYIMTSLAGRDLASTLPVMNLEDEILLDRYLRGATNIETNIQGPCLIQYDTATIGLDRGCDGYVENLFPRDWRRK